MDDNVVDLTAAQPHVNIRTADGAIHIYPMVFFRRVSNGEISIDEVDPLVLRAIVGDWFNTLD